MSLNTIEERTAALNDGTIGAVILPGHTSGPLGRRYMVNLYRYSDAAALSFTPMALAASCYMAGAEDAEIYAAGAARGGFYQAGAAF